MEFFDEKRNPMLWGMEAVSAPQPSSSAAIGRVSTATQWDQPIEPVATEATRMQDGHVAKDRTPRVPASKPRS